MHPKAGPCPNNNNWHNSSIPASVSYTDLWCTSTPSQDPPWFFADSAWPCRLGLKSVSSFLFPASSYPPISHQWFWWSHPQHDSWSISILIRLGGKSAHLCSLLRPYQSHTTAMSRYHFPFSLSPAWARYLYQKQPCYLWRYSCWGSCRSRAYTPGDA